LVTLGNSLYLQLGSLNSSVFAAQSQITSSVADMGAKLTATLSGPSSTFAVSEHLVVVVAIIALVTLDLLLRRGNAKRVPIDQGQVRPAAESISPF